MNKDRLEAILKAETDPWQYYDRVRLEVASGDRMQYLQGWLTLVAEEPCSLVRDALFDAAMPVFKSLE